MKIKKFFHSIFLCLLLISLTSCITQALWRDPYYEERVGQFFVGSDGRYTVLIGEQFHYVFTENSRLLKEVLSLWQRDLLTIDNDKTHLTLDSDNNITGNITSKVPFSLLPPEDQYALQSFGFRPDRNDEVTLTVEVRGRRYAAKYLGSDIAALNRAHNIRIYYSSYSFVKGVGKAAVTPISVTLDAILLIGKVVIYPMSSN